MFKLPVKLSARPGLHQLADFLEWDAWQNGFSSARAINAALGRIDDNPVEEGCEDSSDESAVLLEDAFGEIEDRMRSCGDYPFIPAKQGHSLRHVGETDRVRHAVYYFLLLATRMNMKTDSKQGEHNGTLLFEELVAEVLGNYLGGARVISQVFGTAEGNRFKTKVDSLCDKLKEGGCFKQWDAGRVQKNDAGLDVVSWLPFADQKPNQLIIFAQCKTGDNWSSDHGKLKPEAFFKTWTQSKSVSLSPVSAYCIAEAADRTRWIEFTNQTGGLFFDRCRIVDYCDDLPDCLLKRINEWTKAALKHLSR